MLKNISDYLSMMTLLFITGYSLHAFLLAILSREKDDNTSDRMELIRDYINNEEE